MKAASDSEDVDFKKDEYAATQKGLSEVSERKKEIQCFNITLCQLVKET